jgi:carbon-monoxide dehydrogenase medium subunit
MFPDSFDYYRAESVPEALDLLAETADGDTELIAGGHSLLPTMKSGLASPDALVDIGHIPGLDAVEETEEGIRVGALTNYATVADSEAAWTSAPAFAEAAGQVGDVQVRNAGTVGGNLAHSDPASDLPGAALATDATVYVEGPDGERAVDADDFFVGMYATGLAEDEILTRVEIPSIGPDDAGAYVKKPSPDSGYAMVGVAVRLRTDGERVVDAGIGANGAFDHGTRLDAVEEALADAALDDPDAAADAAAHATDGVEEWELMADIQASADFRANLLEVYTERAIDRAIDRVAGD